ncbi:hypothetical protein [Falsirhodobacter sp. 20TX0035]|uniref:hypothetical protein n=1 Tax=Falsirhodobacter sp. 20TX0035 TaxID=3022019 RepID=UPI00232E715C|nr:hypothetical protein [Falsirhodobacter sp. 20TX0035]MDB6453081.1 hypothetical protein [Falsirhodobacter sp. 20TX0035]
MLADYRAAYAAAHLHTPGGLMPAEAHQIAQRISARHGCGPDDLILWNSLYPKERS